MPVPTEAAFTLLLYCELLQWEERPLREFLHYPSQTEWQRKEGLCRKVIHYFNKGKVGLLGKPPKPQLATRGILTLEGWQQLRRVLCVLVSGWMPVCAAGLQAARVSLGRKKAN